MSLITDVIIITPPEDDDDNHPVTKMVTAGPPDEIARGTFTHKTPLQAPWGGTKVPCFEMYVATFNFCDEGKLLSWLRTISWDEPDRVQVFISSEREDDSVFRELRLPDYDPYA